MAGHPERTLHDDLIDIMLLRQTGDKLEDIFRKRIVESYYLLFAHLDNEPASNFRGHGPLLLLRIGLTKCK